jgi:AraC-like DNA-binding protein
MVAHGTRNACDILNSPDPWEFLTGLSVFRRRAPECRQPTGSASRAAERVMGSTDLDRSRSHFALVTAAEHFILTVLPLREPESRNALDEFMRSLTAYRWLMDLNAIALECLFILNRHVGDRLPSLTDAYLARRRTPSDVADAFRHCVDDILPHQAISDHSIQRAAAAIREGYADSRFHWRRVAALAELSQSHLCDRFRRATGLTPGEYLRHTRLNRAATLLGATELSVKEVWVRVGYNDGSNFSHDFKRQFGLSPVEYRTRSFRPAAVATCLSGSDWPAVMTVPPSENAHHTYRRRLLIVDDDDVLVQTTKLYFRQKGYLVTSASNGTAALHVSDDHLDGVLLDYQLPDMHGLECLRSIRRLNGQRTRKCCGRRTGKQ